MISKVCDIKEIKDIFKNRKKSLIGKYGKSAVMIFLIEENEEIYILFEVRAYDLDKQPGDICLPGGGIEKGEKPLEAAIRESIEELNIQKNDIDIIGEMDYFISPYGFIIYPFIAKLNRKSIFPSKEEVDHIFKVPLNFFMENKPIEHEIGLVPKIKQDYPFELIYNGKNYKFNKGKIKHYFFYLIWL
jgi:8-oxo-dGTP pyrophosphatase MutT (NUDIX family)